MGEPPNAGVAAASVTDFSTTLAGLTLPAPILTASGCVCFELSGRSAS